MTMPLCQKCGSIVYVRTEDKKVKHVCNVCTYEIEFLLQVSSVTTSRQCPVCHRTGADIAIKHNSETGKLDASCQHCSFNFVITKSTPS